MLGPQCVIQGTGILLEGNLICVDCVKGTKRRPAGPILSLQTVLIFGGITCAFLGAVALFFPRQALLVVLLLSIAGVFTGLLGFTLSRKVRLAVIIGSLSISALSSYGMLVFGEKENQKAVREQIGAEADEIKKLLADGYFYEAELRVSAIEEAQLKASGGALSPAAKASIAELRSVCDEWVEKNVGKLGAPELKLLMELYRQFGSVTATLKSRRIRELKISDKTNISLTMALDPVPPVDPESISREQQFKLSQLTTTDPIEAEAIRVFVAIPRKYPDVQTITLKLLSADDGKVLLDKTVDRAAIDEMRLSTVGPRKAPEPGARHLPE